MKRILILSLVLIGISISTNAQTDNKNDIELIKKTILTAYQDGIQNEGDMKKIDKGFHPTFRMIGLRDGKEVWEYPIADWKKSVQKGKEDGKYPRTGDKKVKIEFPMVDVSGSAAIAKLNLSVSRKLTYIDYMSLYKIDGKWKIVAKIYANAK